MWQVSYLYARMYYNKIRKTAYQWWRTYLLFKCCIVVVPIYSFLLLIGLYCIINNIDVTSPLKTFYELAILIFSAAAIFIIVLLLATLNGDGTSLEQLDLDPELMIHSEYQLNRRRNNRSNSRQESSLSSNIMTALFGHFNDPDDPDYEDDDEEPDIMIVSEDNQSTVSMAQLNMAQNRLINTMEQATDNLEFFFDQCDTFDEDPQLISSTHSNPLLYDQRINSVTSKPLLSATNHLPVEYYNQSSNSSTSNQQYRMGRNHYPMIAPPLPSTPPVYSNNMNDDMMPNTPTKPDYNDMPPSYEEATRYDYN